MPSPSSVPQLESPDTSRRERHHRLAEQLREWLIEDPEYDERVGALLEEELPLDRVRLRG